VNCSFYYFILFYFLSFAAKFRSAKQPSCWLLMTEKVRLQVSLPAVFQLRLTDSHPPAPHTSDSPTTTNTSASGVCAIINSCILLPFYRLLWFPSCPR